MSKTKKTKKTYITLAGMQYYYGCEFLEPGMSVKLVKEPDNKYDKEAIVVRMKGLGDIGHVANSVHTVIGDSISAGRLYDRIGKKAHATVIHVMPTGAICKVSKRDLLEYREKKHQTLSEDSVALK